MKTPNYTKTIAGAALIIAAGAALKFRLLPVEDAAMVASLGAGLLGIGIRHGQEKAAQKGGTE